MFGIGNDNKIILTGYSGFVGQNILSYTEKTRNDSIISLNLRENLPNILPQANSIIHLAGKAHDLKNSADPQAYFDINYGLTKELFDRFLKSNINDFVYFSSVKAVADTVDGKLTEDAEPTPETAYGQSKLQAERYLLSKELPQGKRLFILRPCMIHGPGNKGNLNLLYKVVKLRIPYPLGAFHNSRSFLSIENLLFILDRILTNASIPGGIYHLADDEALSTTEVIRIIAKAAKVRARVWNISSSFIIKSAKIGDKIHLPLNSERLKKLIESYEVSNEKIKRALAIKKLPISVREGLAKTIRSFSNS
ncbi:NAD-dependent epimerase/dehydratase family protein [Albibacterium bauzanense]|uniref:Nucleoside-diphosphate-sugar epimerase n=1 Tax=Albibacterium bauzanense TaxID=653929 RepID=A0A4R1LZW1_9SPHI|nr:NAD-dependent epimerase/dehydratase family protein [Albibacterium bauzanense]TCK84885.1 nucleoside-diphosphate-sugar epimerase [Albibacterium bauzanense]